MVGSASRGQGIRGGACGIWRVGYTLPGRNMGPEIPFTSHTTEAGDAHPNGMLSCFKSTASLET